MRKLLGILTVCVAYVGVCMFFFRNVTELVSEYREDFENLTYTELMYEDGQYYVEREGAKQNVLAFSKPSVVGVTEHERVMFPGKRVVCFDYHNDFWVYPQSQFDNSNIRLNVWLISSIGKISLVFLSGVGVLFGLFIFGFLVCMFYVYTKKSNDEYWSEAINRTDYRSDSF